jgi:hypothetical protein
MSHRVITKPVQNRRDKRGGRFGFREEENIRVVCSDQSPESTNCSRARNPFAVPREYVHMQLGDSSRYPKFSMLTNKTLSNLETEERTYFFFLEALKKDLAGSCRLS